MDHSVIVTGASRGIGAATTHWLTRAGAHVTAVARSEEALRRVAESARTAEGSVTTLAVDITEPNAASLIVGTALDAAGRLDALINNAGVIRPIQRLSSIDPVAWNRIVEVCLHAPAGLMRAALPELAQRRGRIVNVASTAATVPIAGLSAYCSAKAGLGQLNRVLAVEEPAVTSVFVQPGPVDTDMQVALRDDGIGELEDDRRAYYERLLDEDLLASPDVPASALAWLALCAPREWSGRELDHDDPEVVGGVQNLFGITGPTGQFGR